MSDTFVLVIVSLAFSMITFSGVLWLAFHKTDRPYTAAMETRQLRMEQEIAECHKDRHRMEREVIDLLRENIQFRRQEDA
jgi:F0F1-type ATP synthase membrane subunit b/b'